jgi:hypothetical protein
MRSTLPGNRHTACGVLPDVNHARPQARCPGPRWPIAILAVAAFTAAACGSGSGGSSAQVSVRALIRRTGCPVTAPSQGPFRGAIVFSADGGSRRTVGLDRRGRAALTVPAGRYRVAVAGPPRARTRVRVRLNGRATPTVAGGWSRITIGGSRAVAIVIVVSAGPSECNALGASG